VVVERFSLGSSRRLTLQKSAATALLIQSQRGRALILDICSIRGGITKLGTSANEPIGIVAPTLTVKDLRIRAWRKEIF